jgi:hypothetical protein
MGVISICPTFSRCGKKVWQGEAATDRLTRHTTTFLWGCGGVAWQPSAAIRLTYRGKAKVRQMLKRPDDTPRDRHFRFRQRAKAGRACCMVEFDGAVLDMLVKLGWLTEGEVGDRRLVGESIARLLAASARR